MTKLSRSLYICGAIAAAPFLFAIMAIAQKPDQHNQVIDAVDMQSVVRLFYQPGDGSYFHPPLLIRVVGDKDARLATAPILKDGRNTYVSSPEMDRLLRKLRDLNVHWKHLDRTAKPPIVGHNVIRDAMELDIYSPAGAERAFLAPQQICSALQPLDSVFTTERALWEFQFFRFQYHCTIPDFNPRAYPLRDFEHPADK